MYTITVEFNIYPQHTDAFMEAMRQQAKNSLELETDCHRFDVAVGESDPCKVFLYELYTSKAAFSAHLASAHFRQFDQRVADWVEHKKVSSWWLQS